jgi:hypothetical protein
MYVGNSSAEAMHTFLSGFDLGCHAAGIGLPNHPFRRRAKQERGWQAGAETWPVSEMKRRGMSDTEIA